MIYVVVNVNAGIKYIIYIYICLFACIHGLPVYRCVPNNRNNITKPVVASSAGSVYANSRIFACAAVCVCVLPIFFSNEITLPPPVDSIHYIVYRCSPRNI